MITFSNSEVVSTDEMLVDLPEILGLDTKRLLEVSSGLAELVLEATDDPDVIRRSETIYAQIHRILSRPDESNFSAITIRNELGHMGVQNWMLPYRLSGTH
ncbi:MAG TPA: hypothetical protein VLF79_04210 [Candidatus Saccharimonadales bacterium]|nr:hypothetical protein [Candidatus Saccharimonadales bacterium]